MLEAGHDAVLLEKGSGIGGVFSEEGDASYNNFFLTTSNFLIAFSDFPPKHDQMKYLSKEEYLEYLENYVQHFELWPHIRLNSEVKESKEMTSELTGEQCWKISYLNGANGNVELEYADALVVATGINQVPKFPKLEGFKGNIMHSADYKSNEGFEGKRVLVIGIGESAGDIAADVSDVAAETVVWSRRPFMLAPRFPFKSLMTPSFDEREELNKNSLDQVSDYLEIMSTSRISSFLPTYLYAMIRRPLIAFSNSGIIGGHMFELSNWLDSTWMADQSQVISKTSRLATASAKGNLKVVVSEKANFRGRNVEFPKTIIYGVESHRENPISVQFSDVDVIICCTGFKMSEQPWSGLEHINMNSRTWYKHCFPPRHNGRLMFLGWSRPHQGGIPPCSELLSRYGGMLLSGERTLPDEIDLENFIKDEAKTERQYYFQTPNQTNLVDYSAFTESLAEKIGCQPSIPSPLTNPSLFFKYWFYPFWPTWYRKDGPNANPDAFNEVMIRKTPVSSSINFLDAGGFFFVEISLALAILPIYRVSSLMSSFSKYDSGGLSPGWMVLKPKRTVLHNAK